MCGLAGLWTTDDTRAIRLVEQAQRMADTLAHRGPDDADVWVDEQAGFAVGFRRLAIVDLSPEGCQPMCSASGRYVVAFNGEIYNFAALRQQLGPRGHRFRGHSDTEVLLAAIEQWGLRAAVEQFVGMFAFVLWDRQERQLALVRDRLGIKPLYYGWHGGALLWGSELKALHKHPAFDASVDRNALALFVRHGYIPAPHSIYRHCRKLPPGSILTLCAPNDEQALPEPYWSVDAMIERGWQQPFTGSPAEAVEHLDQLLREAVRLRMIADVPLGAFLSGGVDSSTVVALMQAQSQQPVKTFSIGFHEAGYDEAAYARAVARHLGTEHTDLYVTLAETQAIIPQLPTLYDEPFADVSQIPTYVVSQLARRQVTVSLSGDGGDELFAGYTRYRSAARLWRLLRLLPYPLRASVSQLLRRDGLAQRFGSGALRAERLQRLVDVLPARDAQALYHAFISYWAHPTDIVLDAEEPPTAFNSSVLDGRLDAIRQMMRVDLLTYLPDAILAKVDRASMAANLEARVPLLDHRLVEFAWTLPLDYKLRAGQSKWALRQVLYRYVSPALIERPKRGFSVPIAAWLRGPLRAWAEELLDEQRLHVEGFFAPAPIRACWRAHCTGERDEGYALWNVLMFQTWLDRWGARRTGTSPSAQNSVTL